MLRRLSVFSGGATPASIARVCALDGDPAPQAGAAVESAATIDIVASLVDKSLVTATGEREVRYRLLETMRAYADERLAEAGETERVRRAHARFFVELAERAEPLLRSSDQVTWLRLLTDENDNCAAALRFAIEEEDVATALRFVGALTWFWLMRDYETVASEWAVAARALAGDTAPAGLEDAYALCGLFAMLGRARAEPDLAEPGQMAAGMQRITEVAQGSSHPMLVVAGAAVTVVSGDLAGARRMLTAMSGHEDPWLRAAALLFSGYLAVTEGDIDAAATGMDGGYAAFRQIGDRWAMSVSLNGMAQVAMARGEPAAAVALLEEARGHAIEGLAANWSEMVSIPLGQARAAAGDLAGARADIEHGVEIAGRLGEHDDEATGYVKLSEIARRSGDLAAARGLLERALEIIEPRAYRMEMIGTAAAAYTSRGCVAEQEGDLTAAAHWHARALATLADPSAMIRPSNPTLAAVVEGIAALAAARGDADRAAELLGLAHVLQGFRNAASLETNRAAGIATAALGEAGFTAAYARGQLLSRADAVALTP
ncbi:MAG: ATP-binding protein [Streptosporangiaceae bacterium]